MDIPCDAATATKEKRMIAISLLRKPARKLLMIRGQNATDYFSFCEEVGCHTWNRLLAMPHALDEPLGLWMPDVLRPAGTSFYIQGVEVAVDNHGELPQGMDYVVLPAQDYLLFSSGPFAPQDMNQVIDQVRQAIERHDPHLSSQAWADTDAPRLQYAPDPQKGYREARPVKPRV